MTANHLFQYWRNLLQTILLDFRECSAESWDMTSNSSMTKAKNLSLLIVLAGPKQPTRTETKVSKRLKLISHWRSECITPLEWNCSSDSQEQHPVVNNPPHTWKLDFISKRHTCWPSPIMAHQTQTVILWRYCIQRWSYRNIKHTWVGTKPFDKPEHLFGDLEWIPKWNSSLPHVKSATRFRKTNQKRSCWVTQFLRERWSKVGSDIFKWNNGHQLVIVNGEFLVSLSQTVVGILTRQTSHKHGKRISKQNLHLIITKAMGSATKIVILLRKSATSLNSCVAILDQCNTPTVGMTTSHAQWFLNWAEIPMNVTLWICIYEMIHMEVRSTLA